MSDGTRGTDPDRPLLRIRNMSKTFVGTTVLHDVDLDVDRGAVHALVGQNGSGKSTLIKLLAGFHQPDPGTSVELDGEPLQLNDAAAARAAGFRFVHQDLGLVHELDTVENLGLGRGYRTGIGGRILWRQERAAARELLESLGYGFDVTLPVQQLGAAERTGVAIARALYDSENARVLVIDEPTATLPRDETATLFEAIDRVRRRGVGVIYVSHHLDEVFAISDHVTILRDGHRVGTYPTPELNEDELVQLMVGGEHLAPTPKVAAKGPGDVLLEVEGLCGTVLSGVDLAVRAGEIVGIAGLTGSGREELLSLLFGDGTRRGTVRVAGTSIPGNDLGAAVDAGLAYVPSDRHRRGSITSLTVRENCTITDMKRLSGFGGALQRGAERTEVEEWIQALDVRPPRPDAIFATLSGGNQQKIVIAKWLRMRPRVLLLDEPTQGVDVHAKAMIHQLARNAADDGAAVVISSTDDAELCDVSDRVVVLRDGVEIATVPRESLTRESLARAQTATKVGA